MKTIFTSRLIAELGRSKDGVAGIEFGFVAGVLTVVALGMIEYERAIHQNIQLQQAARVGAEFAVRYPSDAAGIEQAVTGATGNPSTNLTISVVQFCECPDGTTVTCTDTCSGGASPNTFLQVALAQPASTYFTGSSLVSGLTLHASATLRAK
jgi:Flp pilus assembly protein TadG